MLLHVLSELCPEPILFGLYLKGPAPGIHPSVQSGVPAPEVEARLLGLHVQEVRKYFDSSEAVLFRIESM